ncbi:MAG: S-methyl-5-thioribose-1-phosphate isomerase [Oligoflexia bacterium]|nr:S-methyl-5-thioribose-1-phosphate isomerase [Oligoflexia bacterium]
MDKNILEVRESLKNKIIKDIISPLEWKNSSLHLLDQRILPHQEVIETFDTIEGCHKAIKDMVIRGAPCIGLTAIFGMALWVSGQIKKFANQANQANKANQINLDDYNKAADFLNSARPTAVNLKFEIERTKKIASEMKSEGKNINQLFDRLVEFGKEEVDLAYDRNFNMAQFAHKELEYIYGSEGKAGEGKILKRPLRLMTHCNTGYLACGTLGTALGVVSYLNHLGLVDKVWVDETRPYMQGARLTSYELQKQKIPHDVVVEGAASYLMQKGLVDAIFVGADRIVKNGDTANKVGTSTLAIVAKNYGVPFFVVAPLSSFDTNTTSGDRIEIELRDQEEILSFKGSRVAPNGVSALNPSFDVTRAGLITAIICENKLYKSGEFKF